MRDSAVCMCRLVPWLLAAFIFIALPRAASGGEPVISELLAAGGGTFLDQDGDDSDWLEIHNPGDVPVSLDGWYLTDRAEEPKKWRIPAVTLARKGFLVIFASDKDRADPASELHANFKLEDAGGYLALSHPDGTVAFAFAPSYPPQVRGYSYGLRQQVTSTALIAPGAPAAALVPSSDALGLSWTGVSFDDSHWVHGTTGVGYDFGSDYGSLIGLSLGPTMRNIRSSAFVRVPFTAGDPLAVGVLTLRLKYDDGFVAFLNGQAVAWRNAPDELAFDSAATGTHGQPTSSSLAQDFDGGGAAYELKAWGTNLPPGIQAGGPTGSYLHLMEDYTGNLTNTIGFARAGGPSDVVTAEFDFRMSAEAGYTGGERADGLGFALLDTSVYGDSGPGPASADVVWERPRFPRAFGVGFDIYDGSRTENTVSVDWDGAEVAARKVAEFSLNAGVFHHASIEVRKDTGGSLVSVTLTPDSLGSPGAPVQVFTGLKVPGLDPFACRVAFGGRTGGEFTALDLDNIDVQFTPLSPVIQYEEFDLGAYLGSLKAGANVLAFQGLNASASDADFLIAPALDAMDVTTSPAIQQHFTQPTPGRPNGAGYPGVAEAPVFSKKGGGYSGTLSLALSVTSPLSTIRYTLDRTEPTASSPAYTAPLSISSPTVVRARAFEAGLAPGPLVAQCYLMVAADAQNFTSNLPVMVVHTFGQAIGDGAYVPAQAAVVDPGGARASIRGTADWSGLASIKWRGSSSLGFPKKHYAFETDDDMGQDLDVSILGFPRQSDWVLNGPYDDKTLVRDVLAYYWSNAIGRYAVRTRFIELFVNTGTGKVGSAHYQGVYALMEKIKRDDSRVDVHRLGRSEDSEPEISGGYILKKDRLDPGDFGISTRSGQVLGLVYPKEREISPAQKSWIVNYLNSFETALNGTAYRDPVNGYANYIDVDSFIDHHILVELTKNIDGFRLSTYMFKDRGGKLNMGPVWDYNLSLGNANYLNGWIPQGWYYEQLSDGDYPWYRRLFQDPEFVQRYTDRWAALRRGPFQTAQMLADVEATAALLGESQARNFATWPVLGTYVWPNWFIGPTWRSEIDWMKDWLGQRLDWYDSNYLVAPSFNQAGGPIAPGFSLAMSAPAGGIYYTTDGSDPRLRLGTVSARASVYSDPVAIAENTRVIARARNAAGTRWSAPTVATFVTATPRLVVTELMFHPTPPPAGSPYIDEDFEFVEVQNLGSEPAILMGVRLAGGILFDFSGSTLTRLDPGAYAVVVRNLAAFQSRYPSTGIDIAGVYDRNLANTGDSVVLEGPLEAPILEISYLDTWYPEADGGGRSLVAVDPLAPPDQWSVKAAWRPSSADGGSPGKADPPPGGSQRPGDGNQDGRLDLSDSIYLLGHLFGGSTLPLPCGQGGLGEGGNLAVLNVNGDGRVDISDAVYLLSYLFLGGKPPALGTACIVVDGCGNRCAP
jgi:CotH protein/chitobiase/beta-hexosaminidase-like protein/lamin tail-like protein/Fn3 domain-containing protein